MFSYFCCGWEPILSPNCLPVDWKRISGKCFSLQSIQKIYFDPSRLIGLRHFSGETNYIILDIDHASKYRSIDSIREICHRMSSIGLKLPIFIQSSNKHDICNGIHIYWFLDGKYSTPLLYELIYTLLEYYHFVEESGQLEIFPSRSEDIKYKSKPVRLPLQANSGSYILDENLQPYTNSVDELNRLIPLNLNIPNFSIVESIDEPNEIAESEKIKIWRKNVNALLSRGFTSSSQTQQLIRAAIDKTIVLDKITDLNIICDKVKFIIINLNGYTQYCGHQRNIDKIIKSWVTKTLENEIRLPYRKHPKKTMTSEELIRDGNTNNNLRKFLNAKSNDTLARLVGSIDWLVANKETEFQSLRAFRSRISEVSKNLYGVGIKPNTVQDQKPMWSSRIWIGKK